MKVFFISNGIWEFDGRLRELINVASGLGDIKYITRVMNKDLRTSENHIQVNGNNYFQFVKKAVIEGCRYKNMDIIFVDNRKAIIPASILMFFIGPRKVILDVRELYFFKEVKHITGKIGCIFEKLMIKKADVVICANKYRAELMKEYYCLKATPFVYENLRKLVYSHRADYKSLKMKYSHIFESNTFKIISTSGHSVSRTNDILVEAMSKLGIGYDLLLVGGGTEKDKKIIQTIIDKNKLSNIHFIEKVEEDELKFLISESHLGIVNYHQNDMNNKYCASGKIYEFLYEKLPVVTTENPPLQELCEKFEIGISDNEYATGIQKVKENYLYYKNNVIAFTNLINIESNNGILTSKIKEHLITNSRT